MMIIGIDPALAAHEVNSPYQAELGLPDGENPVPSYHEYFTANGWWIYLGEAEELGVPYSLYWAQKHGRFAAGGLGRALYERCFNTTNPSAICMTGDDYRDQYDASFVDPTGGEAFYAIFEALDSSGRTPGHAFYELMPAGLASDCALDGARTWNWFFSRETAGTRLGSSVRPSFQDYTKLIVKQKKIPSGRNNCALRIMEVMLNNEVTGLSLANHEEALELTHATGFDTEES